MRTPPVLTADLDKADARRRTFSCRLRRRCARLCGHDTQTRDRLLNTVVMALNISPRDNNRRSRTTPIRASGLLPGFILRAVARERCERIAPGSRIRCSLYARVSPRINHAIGLFSREIGRRLIPLYACTGEPTIDESIDTDRSNVACEFKKRYSQCNR